MLILVTALGLSDGRLYEVADALGTSKRRVFWTVTLPGAQYGLISASFVVFTLVITDFGIRRSSRTVTMCSPRRLSRRRGQQNFEMGAVVGMILLVPAVLAFLVDRHRQPAPGGASVGARRALPARAQDEPRRRLCRLFCVTRRVSGGGRTWRGRCGPPSSSTGPTI